jgi:hypothetical protein
MESGRLYPGSLLDLTCAMVSSIARRGAEIVADVCRPPALAALRSGRHVGKSITGGSDD